MIHLEGPAPDAPDSSARMACFGYRSRMRRIMSASLSLSAIVTRLALPLSSTCFSPAMYCFNTSPAALANSIETSRYAMVSRFGKNSGTETEFLKYKKFGLRPRIISLPRGGYRRVCGEHFHQLQESFVLGEERECGFGFDFFRIFKTFFNGFVQIRKGAVLVAIGGEYLRQIEVERRLITLRGLDQGAKTRAVIEGFGIDFEGALIGLVAFFITFHREQARADIQKDGGRFRTNLQRPVVLLHGAIVVLADIRNGPDIIERFQVERILLQCFPVKLFGFVELLALVIHQSQTVQSGGIVPIQTNRFSVFNDRIFVHLAGEE